MLELTFWIVVGISFYITRGEISLIVFNMCFNNTEVAIMSRHVLSTDCGCLS